MKRSTSFLHESASLVCDGQHARTCGNGHAGNTVSTLSFDLSPAIALHDSLPNDVSSRYLYPPCR
jgi:hypothetical protein